MINEIIRIVQEAITTIGQGEGGLVQFSAFSHSLGPQFSAFSIENLHFGDKHDTVNVQINVNLKQPSATNAFMTARKHQPGDEIEEHTIALLAHENQQQTSSRLIPQNIPLGSGTHLIINQRSLWDFNDPIKRANRLKIIPVPRMGDPIDVQTFESSLPRKFEVRLDAEDAFAIQLWGQRKEIYINLSQPESFTYGSSRWIFGKYAPGTFMSFSTLSELPEFVLSLDPKVVKQAVLVERQPDKEYYVFVVQKD